MPDLNGLDTIRLLRERGNSIPIIMCSSLTADGASQTLEALALGAADYVTKPSSHGVNTRDVVGDDLIRKIKALARNPSGKPLCSTRPQQPRVLMPRGSECVIAIGVSTGGPNALSEIFGNLPPTLGVPILVVQHMPPIFTRILAERLGDSSVFPVKEAEDREEVRPNHVYIALGSHHMEVKRLLDRNVISISEGPPENSCRPAVDVLFRSVAKVCGAESLGVILTGTGQDGLKGCSAIREAGESIMLQDRESSAVWGMPSSVIGAGIQATIIPLHSIAAELGKSVKTNGVQPAAG